MLCWNLRIVVIVVSAKHSNTTYQRKLCSQWKDSGATKLNMAEVEAAKKLRSTAKGKFTRAANNLGQAIDTGAPTKTIESRYDELKATWNETQSKHDDFVKLLPGEELDEG